MPSNHVMDIAAVCINYYHDEQRHDGRKEIRYKRLQRILYYVQAQFLVEMGRPCFVGRIERGEDGPVIPTVADFYSIYGCCDIGTPLNGFQLVSQIDTILIEKICKASMSLSREEMIEKIRREAPWIKAEKDGEPITDESIFTYFSNHPEELLVGVKTADTPSRIPWLSAVIGKLIAVQH